MHTNAAYKGANLQQRNAALNGPYNIFTEPVGQQHSIKRRESKFAAFLDSRMPIDQQHSIKRRESKFAALLASQGPLDQ